LQLNLPVTSVRDLKVHGDDLVIATHGRGFWILDNFTPLRQVSSNTATQGVVLFTPANAYRVDNDAFLGTPLPPEEPTAKNPPDGAMVDYYLDSKASQVTLDIYDQNGALVRHIASGQKPATHPPLPIAERWFPGPSVLEISPGMHRYVWDLRWKSSGDAELGDDDEDSYGSPPGPRTVPATYALKLTVDGKSYKQPLKVGMDPRSSATSEVLQDQLRLALQIYGEALQTRAALKEIDAAGKRFAENKRQLQASHPDLLPQLTAVESAMNAIKTGTPGPPGTISGLTAANAGLLSALRAVESGDRTPPAQALEVYRLSSEAATSSLAEWKKLQSGALAQFDQASQAR